MPGFPDYRMTLAQFAGALRRCRSVVAVDTRPGSSSGEYSLTVTFRDSTSSTQPLDATGAQYSLHPRAIREALRQFRLVANEGGNRCQDCGSLHTSECPFYPQAA